MKFTQFIFPAIILIFIVGSIIYREFSLSQIGECHKFTTGHVYLVKLSSDNRGTHVEYLFDGKRYTVVGKIYAKSLPIKEVPIIYPCSNPGFGQILLTPDDFEKYHLSYPDSLRWVLEHLD